MRYLKNIRIYLLAFAVISVTACSSISGLDKQAEYPKSPEDQRRARAGKLTGDGIKLFGGSGDDKGWFGGGETSANVGIGVNSYLWSATLDALSFMPLASADPFGGVVITDWYEDQEVRGERFKVNVAILDKKLKSNALRVSVFRQKFYKEKGWSDVEASPKLANDLEIKILTKARSLRVERESK